MKVWRILYWNGDRCGSGPFQNATGECFVDHQAPQFQREAPDCENAKAEYLLRNANYVCSWGSHVLMMSFVKDYSAARRLQRNKFKVCIYEVPEEHSMRIDDGQVIFAPEHATLLEQIDPVVFFLPRYDAEVDNEVLF